MTLGNPQEKRENERPDQDLVLKLFHLQHTMIWMIKVTLGRKQLDFLEKILQEPKDKIQVEEDVNQQKRDPFAKEMGRTRILRDQG